MREIKFRGKYDLGGCYVWVYGFLSRSNKIRDILTGVEYYVNPETVGQYTGLKDKRGVEIYDRDIVKHNTGYTDSIDKIYSVEYYMDGFILTRTKNRTSEIGAFSYHDRGCDCVVIGNIHDNPELLEVEND